MANQKTKHAIDSGNTVAVVQAASVAFDCKRSLAKALDLIRDASKKGAKLVLFPLPGSRLRTARMPAPLHGPSVRPCSSR
jgi:Carbon-nitrogen hydrolase